MKTADSILLGVLASTLSLSLHAATYKVAEVSDGGTITGKVSFSGDDPAPNTYAITKDPETCGTGDRLIDFVKVNGGALTDVVVYLDKVKSGKAFAENEAKGDIDQKGCEFHPFLQVMHNDHEVSVLNSDAVSHNIHTYELIGRAKKTVFNISQPDQGSVIKKTVKLKRGTVMKVECDQHDFMHGFVFVARNPYYAVVKDDGTFTIDGVPPGKYTLMAWHGTLGTEKAKVTVDAGKTLTTDFEFKAK
ncbi:MAG: hypothetical protein OEN20_09120 [Gammaproteobacteria bacterium]|nr:hypothetical protein [Gammaproteobacteria bacterium]